MTLGRSQVPDPGLDALVARWAEAVRAFDPERLLVEDVGVPTVNVIQTTRLGIPLGRDEHLLYRFVDAAYAPWCTRNPLRRGQVEGRDYFLLS